VPIWNGADMEITLTRDMQRFLGQKIREGEYADASEVRRDASRNFRVKEDPAEWDSQELAASLLPAVGGSHRPVTAKDVDRLRKPHCFS